jgi:drug/metabolite transporter (DMT)-like permease
MLGAILALLSACTFGLNNAAVRRGVLTGTVAQALTVGMPIGAFGFGIAALVSGQIGRIGEFSNGTLVVLGLVGVLHFVIGRYCNYRALKAIGATLSASIQQWTLLVSLVLAVIWLDESMTPLKLFGVAMVMLGPTMALRSFMQRGDSAKSVAAKPADAPAPIPDHAPKAIFEPNLVEGYLFSILSTIGYGVSPIIVRYTLEDTGLALVGGFVSYSAAAVVVLLMLLLPGRIAHIRAIDPRSLPWFTLSGFAVFVSQGFRYLALSVAPVILVIPIIRLALVFRVLFSWLINREHENFEPPVLWGIAISFVGAVALSISTGFVIDSVPMPSWLSDFVGWEWPA